MFKRAAQQLPLKFMKRSGIYQASNVFFDPKKCEALSYNWWAFVRVIGGKVVFNNHRYSNSTVKHQYKVERLLNALDIQIDLSVNTRKSLREFDSLKALRVAVEDQKLSDAADAEEKRVRRLTRAKLRRFQNKMNAEGFYSQAQWNELNRGATLDSYSFERASRI